MTNKNKNQGEVNNTIKKWKKEIEEIGKDLQQIFINVEEFENLRKVVNRIHMKVKDESIANSAFFKSFSAFVNSLLCWYIAFVTMGIRRHLKIKNDSFSLRKLLEEIKNNPEYISIKYFESLSNMNKKVAIGKDLSLRNKQITANEKEIIENSARNLISETKREQVKRNWEMLVGKGNSFLPQKVINNDIEMLKSSGKKIEELADRYIAHLDRKRKDPKLNLSNFAEEIEKIKRISNKYSSLLTGFLCYQSPVFQYSKELFFEEFEQWLTKRLTKQ